jgi:hypothetical protein
VFEELSSHPSTLNILTPSCLGIKKLTAVDRKSISTRDFSECMPVFQSLSDQVTASSEYPFTWATIVGPSHCSTSLELSLCHVLIHECVRCMYDKEVAVRASALSALKALVTCASQWSGLLPSSSNSSPSASTLELIRIIVLPGIHTGIKLGLDNVKKGFVQLLNHILKTISRYCTSSSDQETFHSDLFFLTNDDPEQDFFESIIHIQLHRRSRVLTKLRGLLSTHSISSRSFLQIVLPLAFYPLLSDEFSKKDHAVLLQESAALIGAVARYLKWGQYHYLIKVLLKHLRREKIEKEKILISTLCAILDSFHFELSPVGEGAAAITGGGGGQVLKEDEGEVSESEDEDEPGDVDEPKSEKQLKKVSPVPKQNVTQCVLQSIYPQVKSFLIKPGKDHTGNKSEIVRPLIAVALVKLLKRFEPPLLSKEKKNGMLTNLVLNIVNTLKGKDSAARDMARDSLAKMVSTMGLDSLKLVLTELKHGLPEGYQRHVRNYTVRSLLTIVMEDYSPPVDVESLLSVDQVNHYDVSTEKEIVFPSFDQCLPLIMQYCLDEISGTTFEDKNVDDAKRKMIREARGNKANEIFELCGRCLLFRPSNALSDPQQSSVHLLVTPLLETLRASRGNDFSSTTSGLIGRTTEALQRASVGLSKNPSLKATELFLYLHSTLTPFVATLVKELKSRGGDSNDANDDLNSYIPSYLREDSSDEEEAALYSKKQRKDSSSKKTKANVWLPSERKANTAQRDAVEKRNEDQRELFVVQDGVSAPKLTGRNRYKRKIATSQDNLLEADPAFTAAVKFCLTLLLACLKQKRLDGNEEIVKSMATPFLPLFAQCLRVSGNSGIVVLAMRCICGLLSWGLSVDPLYSRSIGKRMLELMYRGGAVLSTDNDLVQTCIKGLSSLFLLYNKSKRVVKDEDLFNPLNATADDATLLTTLPKKSQEKLPLEMDSIRALLSLLTASILEVATSYQNSAFQLIRAIVDSGIVVPEMYDLIKALIDQIVLSHRKGVRDVAASVVIAFLLSYPIGKKRLESHIKQFIANCSYEFEEGRYAALGLILDLCRLLPIPVLDEYALLIFLPMAMQIVNDNSSTCRSRAADVIKILIRRSSPELATQCWSYSLQWLGVQGDSGQLENYQARCVDITQRPLLRTGAQVAGLLVSSRHDIVKRGAINNILLMIKAAITEFALVDNTNETPDTTTKDTENEEEGNVGGLEPWSLLYHLLTLLEKLYDQLPAIVEKSIAAIQRTDHSSSFFMLELIEEAMLFPHAWVRSVACRIIQNYLRRRDPIASNFNTPFAASPTAPVAESEILLSSNALYNLARRLCLVLNYPVIIPSLLPPLTSCLVFTIRAMYYHPNLVTLKPEDEEKEREEDEEGVSSKQEQQTIVSSNWAMQRLRAIGADSRGSKRFNVIKVTPPCLSHISDLSFTLTDLS